ncbi:OmpA family protein [Tsuneonella sp. HG222]
MRSVSTFARPGAFVLAALLAMPAATGAFAQQLPAYPEVDESRITVVGTVPADISEFPEGPDVDGFISARKGDRFQVTSAEGASTVVGISQGTQVRSKSGLFGLTKTKLDSGALLNGLPVTVKTVQWNGGLVAREVQFKNGDFKTAAMIQRGTAQGFAEQTAATDALRSRVADIDNYLIKGTTNVNFDTGQAIISPQAKADLCAAAEQAKATENAMLLVVGYTDSTGSWEVNQDLSEKRASRVVAYLQQQCGWEPQRMLTPAGMATSDPLADNSTEFGKAQNRRVAVNILVSKAVEGI